MTTSMIFDYGECLCLTGRYENRYVEVRMTVGENSVLFKDVPQGACPSCGSRVYKAEILERIEATMKGEPFDRKLSQFTAPA